MEQIEIKEALRDLQLSAIRASMALKRYADSCSKSAFHSPEFNKVLHGYVESINMFKSDIVGLSDRITDKTTVRDLRVVELSCEDYSGRIVFEAPNGKRYALYSDNSSPYTVHYLDPSELNLDEFDGLLFDINWENLESVIERVDGFGIRLIPKNGHKVFIPGYGDSWTNYSDMISLTLSREAPYGHWDDLSTIDITECQKR
ncbi:hypothetical protein [uncultured Porphyromonas sp.]|uniref:hypothetical protein n=1 Tax=uncultured Porphyromonas sp. TaxID=159274 RepID=UPI0026061211|nr:hypothetical protein [uncultured Porphyromonas sp.]